MRFHRPFSDPKIRPYPKARRRADPATPSLNQTRTIFFPLVCQLIRNAYPHQETWYLYDKDTVTRLVRCMLHRLDFEGAIRTMRSAIKTLGYGHKMDRDIQRIFTEIGDPSGSICFKLASGIMGGEVNPTKTRHYSTTTPHLQPLPSNPG